MIPTCPKCEGPMVFLIVIREGKLKFKLYECPEDGELEGVRE